MNISAFVNRLMGVLQYQSCDKYLKRKQKSFLKKLMSYHKKTFTFRAPVVIHSITGTSSNHFAGWTRSLYQNLMSTVRRHLVAKRAPPGFSRVCTISTCRANFICWLVSHRLPNKITQVSDDFVFHLLCIVWCVWCPFCGATVLVIARYVAPLIWSWCPLGLTIWDSFSIAIVVLLFQYYCDSITIVWIANS